MTLNVYRSDTEAFGTSGALVLAYLRAANAKGYRNLTQGHLSKLLGISDRTIRAKIQQTGAQLTRHSRYMTIDHVPAPTTTWFFTVTLEDIKQLGFKKAMVKGLLTSSCRYHGLVRFSNALLTKALGMARETFSPLVAQLQEEGVVLASRFYDFNTSMNHFWLPEAPPSDEAIYAAYQEEAQHWKTFYSFSSYKDSARAQEQRQDFKKDRRVDDRAGLSIETVCSTFKANTKVLQGVC